MKRDPLSKIPPHHEEAELSVLGGLMLDQRSLDDVIDIITPADFYFEKHRLIFEAILRLSKASMPFDFICVMDALRNHVDHDRRRNPDALTDYERINDPGILGTMVCDTPGAANVAAYASIVREKAILRELIASSHQNIAQAQSPEGLSGTELLDEAEQRLLEIRRRNSRDSAPYLTMPGLMAAIGAKIEQSRDNPQFTRGLQTGFKRFDALTNGLHKGDLVIVAGRPSMGKTSFALNLAEYAALTERQGVAIFSMEMSGEQLGLRILSSYGRIDQQNLRTGQLDDLEWSRFSAAIGAINEAPIFIDETGGLSPAELRSRARRIAMRNPLSLIVVDYIQLMQVPGSESRTNEISEISRSLKALAKELNVPIVALSQLNRGVENRDNKRPRMADLRESGGIEQDADVIVFIYRDEVYNPETPDKGTAELIVCKQRNGPTGTCKAAFLGQFTRFDNLEVLAPDDYA